MSPDEIYERLTAVRVPCACRSNTCPGTKPLDADPLMPVVESLIAEAVRAALLDAADAIDAVLCSYRADDGCDYCSGLTRAAAIVRARAGDNKTTEGTS